MLALIIAAVGWHYAFQSGAAVALSSVESAKLNARRMRLRRAGGVMMMLLAIGLVVGLDGVDADQRPGLYLAVWAAVMFLLAAVVFLASIDLRLTWQARRKKDST